MRIVESKKPQQNGDASDGIDDTIPEIQAYKLDDKKHHQC